MTNNKLKNKLKSALGLLLILAFFIISSYIVNKNLVFVKSLIGTGFLGITIYLLILIISTIIAPINDIPLIPVASAAWGWFWAAIICIIGWTIGAILAFVLARKYGTPLVNHFFSDEKIDKYKGFVPNNHLFWSIVFLRIAVPVDIISYLVGLFSRINLSTYIFATLLGVAPSAFFFAYFGTLPLYVQIIGVITFSLILLFGFLGLKYKILKRE